MGPFGHLSAGIAVRAKTNIVPLPVLLVAAYFIELMYFLFAALNLDTPEFSGMSHSLLMSVVWSLVAGFIWLAVRRKLKPALIVAAVTFSHWVADFLVWNNLPLYPGAKGNMGLGLYRLFGFELSEAGANLPTILITILDLGLMAVSLVFLFRHRRKEKK